MKKMLFFFSFLIFALSGQKLSAQHITTETEVGCSLDTPPEPNPDDSTSCIRVCSGSQVVFDANTSANPDDITWSVVGGTILVDNGSTVTVNWPSPGAGSITVKVVTDDGVITDTKCIEILQGPEARFGVLPDTLQSPVNTCTYRQLQFKDMSLPLGTSPIVAWNWDFGDGNYSNVPNPSHEYTSPGVYEVTLEVVNSCNCRSEFMIEIVVDEAEQLIIDCPSVVCEGQQVRYKVQDGCGIYDWQAVGGTIQAQSQGIDFVDVIWDQVGGDGFGYISVYDIYCGARCTAPTTIKVPVIKSIGTIDGPNEICEGRSYLYRLPQWPATEFTWSKTGADISIQPSDQPNEIIVTVNSATASTATLRCVYNNNLVNCGGKAIKELKIRPSASISGPKLLCADIDYDFQLSNGFNGDWDVIKEGGGSVAGGSGNVFTVNLNDPGNYTVIATGTDFCTPDPFAFEVQEKPAAPADLDGPTTVCPGIPYSYNTYPDIPGTTFNWTIVGGTFSNSQSITSGADVSATFTGNGPYQLKIWRKYKNGTGCVSDTFTQVITREIVEPNIQGADTSCDNSYSLYTAAYSYGELYEWSIIPETHGSVTSGDGTQSVNILWNSLASPQYVDVVVKVRKCGSSYYDTMSVYVVPVSNVSINAPAFECSGYNINISMNAGVPINSFSNIEWDFGDGNTATTTSTSVNHVYESGASTPLTYTIIMKLNDPNGCGTTVVKTKTITINPSPIASAFTAGPMCESQPGDTLYAVIQSGAGATATFEWYKVGTIGVQNTTSKYVAPGYGSYYCVVTAVGTMCRDTTNIIAVDTASCPASTLGSDSIDCDVCIGDAFSQYPVNLSYYVSGCQEITIFTNSPYPSGYVFDEYWKWGANPDWYDVSKQDTAIVKYNQVGTYKVTYRACHYYGKSTIIDPDSVCYTFHDIYVEVPYVPDFKFDITCQSNGVYQVNVVDHSNYHPNASIDTYTFYRNDLQNNVQTGSSIMYTDTFSPGTYIIKMDIEGSGHPPCSIIDTLELPDFPVADFSFNFDGACMGYPIEFTNLSTPSTGLTYEWDFTGNAKNTVQDPSRVFPSSGTKNVSLTVTNSLGCSDTQIYPVNVSPNQLTPTISSNKTIECDNGTIVLTGTQQNVSGIPTEAIFQPNDFAVVTWPGTGNSVTTSVFESGSYFVILKDANECREASISTTVEFVPSPNPQIEGPTDVCVGDSIHLLGDLGEGGFIYGWTQGGPPTISTDPNLTVYAGSAGTFNYTLNVARNTLPQCWSSDVHTVVVHGPPASPDVNINLVSCQPYTIELSVSNTGSGTYTWSDGQSGPDIEVTEGGNFTVTYTNDWGCTSEAIVYVPKSPEEYIWIYPLGCYDLCPAQVDGSEEFDLPDPIIAFKNWSLNDPVNPVSYGATGSGSVPDIFIQTPYTGQYSFTLENDFCDYTASFFNLQISENCNCEIRVEWRGSHYSGSPGNCRNYVDFYIDNPYGQPITVNLNSPNGIFVPSSILVPPGGTSVTVEFIPNPGYTGPMDTWMASTHNPDDFSPCYMEGEYELPQPLCNDTSWYKQAAARTADDTDAEHSFSLAPNPAISEVGVIYDLPMWVDGSKGTIEVYNLQGALMGEYEVTQAIGTQMVQTEKWSPSVYIVLIRVNDRVVDYRRLAIQR